MRKHENAVPFALTIMNSVFLKWWLLITGLDKSRVLSVLTRFCVQKISLSSESLKRVRQIFAYKSLTLSVWQWFRFNGVQHCRYSNECGQTVLCQTNNVTVSRLTLQKASCSLSVFHFSKFALKNLCSHLVEINIEAYFEKYFNF